jgi:hypothetical protein
LGVLPAGPINLLSDKMMRESDKVASSRRLFKYAIVSIAFTICIVVLFTISHLVQSRRTEIHRLAEVDQVTLRDLVREVNAICDHLGRIPKDQEELESLMGRLMPHTHRYTEPMEVRYHRRTDNIYVLSSFTTSGMKEYASSNPEDGWVEMD